IGLESVTRLADLAAGHGPILITKDDAERLRRLDSFQQSDLVIAEAPGWAYATVKFSPAKSQARRTRTTNTEAKRSNALALGQAASRMRAKIDNLSREIRHDLSDLGLTAA